MWEETVLFNEKISPQNFTMGNYENPRKNYFGIVFVHLEFEIGNVQIRGGSSNNPFIIY